MTLRVVATASNVALTKLASRERFEEYFAAELERSKRFEYSLALLIITVPGIKPGQRRPLLSAMADACAGSIRAYDYACHIRENQFAIMLPQTYNPGAREVARRVERQFLAEAQQQGILASPALLIGVAYPLPPHLTGTRSLGSFMPRKMIVWFLGAIRRQV